jgi:hypothetical protein
VNFVASFHVFEKTTRADDPGTGSGKLWEKLFEDGSTLPGIMLKKKKERKEERKIFFGSEEKKRGRRNSPRWEDVKMLLHSTAVFLSTIRRTNHGATRCEKNCWE